MSRASIKLSKEHAEAEIRNVVRKVSHRPVAEIVEIIRQRMNVAVDPKFVESILAGNS